MVYDEASGREVAPPVMVAFGPRPGEVLHLEVASELLKQLRAAQPAVFGKYLQKALGIK